jgi:hypothetical protein
MDELLPNVKTAKPASRPAADMLMESGKAVLSFLTQTIPC